MHPLRSLSIISVIAAASFGFASQSEVRAADGEIPAVEALVVAIGGAVHHGDPAGLALQGPLVALAPTPTGGGYWLAGSDGGVFAYGDAPWLGSIPDVLPIGVHLAEPIVDIAAHPSGAGYWMFASDGGVFAYGSAPWFGSIPQVLPHGTRLAAPISAAAATPTGNGYWLLGADGGVFTFGDAAYHGSVPQRSPGDTVDAVALVATASGDGYTIHFRDGRVESFGAAASQSAATGPVADADRSGPNSLSTTVGGITSGTLSATTTPGTGVSAVALSPTGGAWILRNGVGPVVSIWQSGGLTATSLQSALHAASLANAQSAVSHGGSIDYVSTRRRGALVDAAPSGFRIPMSAMALDADSADVLIGAAATRAMQRDELIVGRRAADRHDIRRGDVVELFGWDGQTRLVTVGHIGEATEIGNIEIAMSRATALSLGFDRSSAVLLWAFDPDKLDAALASLPSAQRWLTVSRSWVSSGRDGVLSTAVLKDLAGEPAYLPGDAGDAVQFQQSWIDEHIAPVDLPVLGTIRCHRAIADQLIAVFTEIESQGLADSIDVEDTRAHGGCFYPRTIRGSSGGSLSRHSWGVAIDVNPRTNAFGATPTIDQRVVDIFRSRGFAWGGTWIRQDGMHFEWTGS